MMDSHTTRSITPSVSWHTDAHKYDRGHVDTRQGYPQALLRKSYMCDKWIEGLPLSWVWWCFRINCKVLCLVYYYSDGPYIPFIFIIGYFPDILKITKMQTIFKKINMFYLVVKSQRAWICLNRSSCHVPQSPVKKNRRVTCRSLHATCSVKFRKKSPKPVTRLRIVFVYRVCW